jgi:hypothetical protein
MSERSSAAAWRSVKQPCAGVGGGGGAAAGDQEARPSEAREGFDFWWRWRGGAATPHAVRAWLGSELWASATPPLAFTRLGLWV